MESLPKTQTALESLARRLALSAVIGAPWLFGASEPWAYLSLNLLVLLAGLVWLISVLVTRPPCLRCPATTGVLLLLTAWVGLQILPLPDRAVAWLNPSAWRLHSETRFLLGELAKSLRWGAIQSSTSWTLSLAPAGTRRALSLWIGDLVLWMVLVNTCRRWRHVAHACAGLVASGFLLAIVSMVHKFSGSSALLWLHEPKYDGSSVFGPFTNRNHFAAHANLLLGVVLGLALAVWRTPNEAGPAGWRERLARLSTARASGLILLMFTGALLGGSVGLTLSRGGLLSLGVALVGLSAAIIWRRGPMLGRRSAVLAATGFAFTMAVWFGSDPLWERLSTLRDATTDARRDLRTVVTLDTFRLFRTHPLLGVGFGAFRHAYPLVQSPPLRYRWLHAHNDWAELLAEGGAGGTVLFLAAGAVLAVETRRALRTARLRARLLAAGLTVSLSATAVHSLVDYSLHKPANAWLLTAVTALVAAAAHLARPKDEPRWGSADATKIDASGRGGGLYGRTAAIVALVALTLLASLQMRELRGELALARLTYAGRMADAARDPLACEQAIRSAFHEADLAMEFARSDPQAMLELSARLAFWQADTRLRRQTRVYAAEKAAEATAVAVVGAPSDYLTWLNLLAVV